MQLYSFRSLFCFFHDFIPWLIQVRFYCIYFEFLKAERDTRGRQSRFICISTFFFNHHLLNTGNKFQLINNSGFELCALSSDLPMLRCANQTLGTLYSFLSNQAALRHLVNSRSMCLLHSNFTRASRHNFRSSKFFFFSLCRLRVGNGT